MRDVLQSLGKKRFDKEMTFVVAGDQMLSVTCCKVGEMQEEKGCAQALDYSSLGIDESCRSTILVPISVYSF